MKTRNTIRAIRDALASQQRRGEAALIVRIEPNLIQDAVNALPGYTKVFAPVVPGVTDLLPIYEVTNRNQEGTGFGGSFAALTFWISDNAGGPIYVSVPLDSADVRGVSISTYRAGGQISEPAYDGDGESAAHRAVRARL